MKKVALAVFAAGVLGGCATTDSGPAAEPREEAVYRTGSNIPSKQKSGDGVQTYDREALERARNESVQVPRGGIPGAKPGG